MSRSTRKNARVKSTFSPRSTLAAIGVKVAQIGLFEPIAERVKIAQKVVKYTPIQKMQDAFMNMLSGGQGTVEINKRVRSDKGLQRAFSRSACAEQSVVQDTLDACTPENVDQMHKAMDVIFRRHSLAYRHDYQKLWQVLDVDLTGRPCGKKAASATKGYFCGKRNRYGRQVGYVLATLYQEIATERLFDGKTQLSLVMQDLMKSVEKTLDLDEDKRKRTIVRFDAGGGSVEDINWLLSQEYRFIGKDYSGPRIKNVVKDIHEWGPDPAEPGREVAWAPSSMNLYSRPVHRIAVRCRKKNGQYGLGLILSNLTPAEVLLLTGQDPERVNDLNAVMLAYVYYYDQRGGGVETEIKADKQGLGTSKRNKKRFPAQQMLLQLEVLAHNTSIWARGWLVSECPRIADYGVKRLVRDVFTANGRIVFDQAGRIVQVILNSLDPLARALCASLATLLKGHVAVILGET